MAKHIDLLAVGALLLVFAIGARVKDVMHPGTMSVQMLRIRAINPLAVRPPHVPAVPHLPHFPRV
jgi:hypothetical protein